MGSRSVRRAPGQLGREAAHLVDTLNSQKDSGTFSMVNL